MRIEPQMVENYVVVARVVFIWKRIAQRRPPTKKVIREKGKDLKMVVVIQVIVFLLLEKLSLVETLMQETLIGYLTLVLVGTWQPRDAI